MTLQIGRKFNLFLLLFGFLSFTNSANKSRHHQQPRAKVFPKKYPLFYTVQVHGSQRLSTVTSWRRDGLYVYNRSLKLLFYTFIFISVVSICIVYRMCGRHSVRQYLIISRNLKKYTIVKYPSKLATMCSDCVFKLWEVTHCVDNTRLLSRIVPFLLH